METWLLCATPSVFGTQEAGLDITADGRWSKLATASDGTLVRATGWNQEGTWESLDNSAMNGGSPTYQLNLHIDGSGTVITNPVFAAQPSIVRLNNMGLYVANYARLTTPLPAP